MNDIMGNAYVYWIITGVSGAIFGTLIYLIKRELSRSDKRMEQITKTQADDHEQLEKTLRELPLTYTLREEFLRVTALQTNKMDKLTDMMSDIGKGIATLNAKMGDGKND